ncbi:hypothetical protein [Saccharothrix sp. NRRL B-16348]|uniref:hypothetical protein n=1 Tax=Saccharothrix sp. NRRL B-16348 TaxID=1415542 RepID=UPI000B0A7EBF|nr:hypothetical protein [Saccharothrix sp. NRRL B-16348]
MAVVESVGVDGAVGACGANRSFGESWRGGRSCRVGYWSGFTAVADIALFPGGIRMRAAASERIDDSSVRLRISGVRRRLVVT